MIALTPTQRLEWLRDEPYLADARKALSELLAKYEKFLETTNASESDLINRFMDAQLSRQFMDAASEFGTLVFEALEGIGKRSHFHRLLVV